MRVAGPGSGGLADLDGDLPDLEQHPLPQLVGGRLVAGPCDDGLHRALEVVLLQARVAAVEVEPDRRAVGLVELVPADVEREEDLVAVPEVVVDLPLAAPHVSGILAAFLSRRREFIGEPDRVKKILLENCTDLERDRLLQGAGMPNLVRMLVAT